MFTLKFYQLNILVVQHGRDCINACYKDEKYVRTALYRKALKEFSKLPR